MQDDHRGGGRRAGDPGTAFNRLAITSAPMHSGVVPTAHEQEYLLRAIESGAGVRNRHQFFLWAQGQLQALLAHDILVGLQLGADDEVMHAECLHSGVLDADLRATLQHPREGLVVQLARACRQGARLPCWIDRDGGPALAAPALEACMPQLQQLQLGHVLLHGSGPVGGGASFFALFGLRRPPDARSAYFVELLLPHLHLALQRVRSTVEPVAETAVATAATTEREEQILHWVRQGKTNAEIGQLLGISALTVKSHLQRIYRKLQVHNRAQAVSRSRAP